MLTVLLLLAAVAVVLAAGEAVRGQCRRMLSRPIPLVSAADVAPQVRPVAAQPQAPVAAPVAA
jgi:hypothetical protein